LTELEIAVQGVVLAARLSVQGEGPAPAIVVLADWVKRLA
jgi:hypothetical protein